jgi:hypothetical protein
VVSIGAQSSDKTAVAEEAVTVHRSQLRAGEENARAHKENIDHGLTILAGLFYFSLTDRSFLRDEMLRFLLLGLYCIKSLGLSYNGPTQSLAKIDGGFSVEELGITVCAGKSTLPGSGMGMFLCLNENVKEVVIPFGTVLCGYSNSGTLQDEGSGDKTVGYYFDSLDQGCVFQKMVLSLRDVLYDDPDDPLRILGHSIDPNDSDRLLFDSTLRFNRHFVPAKNLSDKDKFSPQEIGVLANDLGFTGIDTTQESYEARNDEFNILELVWRLVSSEEDATLLIPTYPVVMTSRDILLSNDMPMEVGLQYGFRYWQQTILKQQKEKLQEGESKV